MTPKQIRNKLVQSGFTGEEIDNHLTISRDSVDVYVVNDYDATETFRERVSKVLGWGGFKTGYGAWVLQNNFKVHDYDYCDLCSPVHY